jgi:Protein of unknown function (DUF1592)/Protein of unknown function (DUF1588)/Protein of unknown function (DUF1587)/Protein of unknown function (DUF1585)/Protein of unknown function (DUF1595)/Planctomycete cytochrome C
MFKHFLICLLAVLVSTAAQAQQSSAAADFKRDVQPLLVTYCYDCHGDGASKGGVAFDKFNPDANPADSRDLWWKALKNLRSGLMPPAKRDRPTAAEQERITSWIKKDEFGLDPQNPDPGRVTVRRLNRAEYRNTIRDLMGVDYDTVTEFPPDDTGNGFDNIGDVLTLSPMLLEKYLNAAQIIVAKVVPMTSKVLAEKTISGASFGADGKDATGPLSLSYYDAASVSNTFQIEHAGHYQIVLNMSANEKYVDNQFDYNKCRFIFTVDGQELFTNDFNREGSKPLRYEFNQELASGDHKMSFEVQPLTPGVEHIRSLTLRINAVTLRGPSEEKYQVAPANYRSFFPKDVPASASGKRAYAGELLKNFASKAFRHPVDDQMVNRLVALAEGIYSQPRQTFEAGVAQAMVAVLASPRFLFREEGVESTDGKSQPLVDEYALASRLSYFLWSSMPDDELFKQAAAGTLRKNLDAEVKRMLADSRSEALMENFSGQWLETRDITTVAINAQAVLARDAVAATNAIVPNFVGTNAVAGVARGAGRRGRGNRGGGRPQIDLDDTLRKAMQDETYSYFGYIVHEDRDVRELIDSDYTFLNARLAQFYGLTNLNVTGDELHKVTLPSDSPRGGVLTMGSVLAVTSNPTRTSPVKRGLFILDNIVGTPSPPPPANIPPLEDSESGFTNHQPTLREVLSVHRSQPLCASCHDRLDPPGLALENFNAMGMFRDKERGQTIETGGQLITGEPFDNVRELKHILATQHSGDFYHCLTEKLLTYALGRGLEYYDVQTVDQIVDQLQKNDGKFSALLMGVIESAPFQKSRSPATVAADKSKKPLQPVAEVN